MLWDISKLVEGASKWYVLTIVRTWLELTEHCNNTSVNVISLKLCRFCFSKTSLGGLMPRVLHIMEVPGSDCSMLHTLWLWWLSSGSRHWLMMGLLICSLRPKSILIVYTYLPSTHQKLNGSQWFHMSHSNSSIHINSHNGFVFCSSPWHFVRVLL